MQQAATAGARTTRWEAIGASTIGTIVEWYDFYLYGTAAALVLNKVFFPNSDPLAGILASYATFAVGFLVRPFGGVMFGHFGDKYGRKPVLIATLLLMGFGTAAIGLLPTYAPSASPRRSCCCCCACCRAWAPGPNMAARSCSPPNTQRPPRFLRELATVCLRSCHRALRRGFLPLHADAGGSVHRLGLAHAFPA